MKKALLLPMWFLLLLLIIVGCNGAGMDNPSTNPLPGQGTEDPGLDDLIDANYAVDIIPQREIPDSVIVDDPEWAPLFESMTEDPRCIDEGCMNFKLVEFDKDAKTVTFAGTFFNPNKDSMKNLTVFFLVTQTTKGVAPVEPDGLWRIHEFDTKAYPYFAFSNGNNDQQTPGSMYNYFERDIQFAIEEGADFHVTYELIALYDTQDLSYQIDIPDPVHEENESGNEGEGGGSDGRTGSGDDPEGSESGGNPGYHTPGVRPPA